MILVHLAEGFEEVEALTVVDVLRRVDLPAYLVSVTGDKMVTGTHGIRVEADYLFEELDYNQCDMIVLPGGLPGATNLRDHKGLCEKIVDFAEERKGLAAICAAPLVLGSLGVLRGKKATIYPGMEDELGGGEPIPFPVVRDMNIITSQGPGTAMRFAIAILSYFKGKEVGDEMAADLLI